MSFELLTIPFSYAIRSQKIIFISCEQKDDIVFVLDKYEHLF